MRAKSFLIVLGFLSLVGCTSQPDQHIAIISNDAGARSAEVKLAEAADSVSESLHDLDEIEKATHPQAKLPPPLDPDMTCMGQLATIEWTGPIGPLVDKIAKATGYRVRVLGKAPAIPVLVAISARDTPLSDILRDANFQCRSKANIVVYPASKIIELRYAKA